MLARKRKILGTNHPSLAASLLQYSGVLRYRGQLSQATQVVSEANEIYISNFGEFSMQAGSSLNSLAVMSYQNGDFAKAIEQMSRAVKIYEKLQSSDYADTLEIKTNLTALLIVNNRLDEALKLGREVYEIQLRKLGKEHDSTIYSQQVLAKVLIKMNKIDEAFVLVKDVFTTSKSVLTQSNPLYTGAYLLYGQILDKNKDYKQAEKIYQEIVSRKLFKDTNPNYPGFLMLFAKLKARLKQKKQAIDLYQQSLDAFKMIFGENHTNTKKAQKDFNAYLKESR